MRGEVCDTESGFVTGHRQVSRRTERWENRIIRWSVGLVLVVSASQSAFFFGLHSLATMNVPVMVKAVAYAYGVDFSFYISFLRTQRAFARGAVGRGFLWILGSMVWASIVFLSNYAFSSQLQLDPAALSRVGMSPNEARLLQSSVPILVVIFGSFFTVRETGVAAAAPARETATTMAGGLTGLVGGLWGAWQQIQHIQQASRLQNPQVRAAEERRRKRALMRKVGIDVMMPDAQSRFAPYTVLMRHKGIDIMETSDWETRFQREIVEEMVVLGIPFDAPDLLERFPQGRSVSSVPLQTVGTADLTEEPDSTSRNDVDPVGKRSQAENVLEKGGNGGTKGDRSSDGKGTTLTQTSGNVTARAFALALIDTGYTRVQLASMKRTVHRWMATGKVPGAIYTSEHWEAPQSALDAMLDRIRRGEDPVNRSIADRVTRASSDAKKCQVPEIIDAITG